MRPIPGWICSATAIALCGLASVHAATTPESDAAESVFAGPPAATPVREPTGSPAVASTDAEKTVSQLQKRLEAIESRLGASSRPPSIAYNVERRLADLEQRVQQIEQQLARMQQFDQRIRRLEMK